MLAIRFVDDYERNPRDVGPDSGRGNGSRNKLRTYRMFKQDFYLEPYLLQNEGFCYQQAENDVVLEV